MLKELIASLKEKLEKRHTVTIDDEEPRAAPIEENESDEFPKEQILIKFRSRPGEDAIDVNHEFTHIPSEDEIKEEFGPGLYNVFVQEERGKRPKLRRRYKIPGHPTLPVDVYELKLRVSEGGQLFDTNIEFPGPIPPSREEIINSLGGGGYVKINAKNKEGRIIWSEWYDLSDIEPPEIYVRRDNSIKSLLEKEVEKKKQKVEEEIIEKIKEEGNGRGKSKFDAAVDKLIESIEDKKLDRLEKAIEVFVERLNKHGTNGTETKKGLSDIAFSESYLTKLRLQEKIISELAKKDPEAAMSALKEMPDGVTIGMNLAIAGTGLIEVLRDYMRDKTKERRRLLYERKGESGRKEVIKEELSEEKKEREEIVEEEPIPMEIETGDKGFEVTFDIGED